MGILTCLKFWKHPRYHNHWDSFLALKDRYITNIYIDTYNWGKGMLLQEHIYCPHRACIAWQQASSCQAGADLATPAEGIRGKWWQCSMYQERNSKVSFTKVKKNIQVIKCQCETNI